MSLTSFYEVTTALCFALLGFWWIVVQLRHDEFTTDRRLRAIAYQVSMSFVLPGLMSLAALLAVENNFLWRVGFGVAAAIGVAQTIYFLVTSDTGSARLTLRLGRWLMLVLYALIGVVAIRPTLPREIGIDASALAVEATMVTLFIFLGVNLAWSYFMHPAAEPLP